MWGKIVHLTQSQMVWGETAEMTCDGNLNSVWVTSSSPHLDLWLCWIIFSMAASPSDPFWKPYNIYRMIQHILCWWEGYSHQAHSNILRSSHVQSVQRKECRTQLDSVVKPYLKALVFSECEQNMCRASLYKWMISCTQATSLPCPPSFLLLVVRTQGARLASPWWPTRWSPDPKTPALQAGNSLCWIETQSIRPCFTSPPLPPLSSFNEELLDVKRCSK